MALLIRHAQKADLPAIVAIYNAAIPGHLATADTEPVTVDSREDWFAGFIRPRGRYGSR
jgi:phosphinothricin acetyltransferase